MAFQPIAGSAYGRESDADIDTLPFLIPEGYQQRVVSSERDLNLYVGSDMLDMNTVNETGKQAGRYLYRTHEVRPGAVGNDKNARRLDGGSGGAVSVVDLQTGAARELVGRPDWEALDGIVWTPWHTLLVTEEAHTTVRPDPAVPLATSGLVYEIRLAPGNPMAAASVSMCVRSWVRWRTRASKSMRRATSMSSTKRPADRSTGLSRNITVIFHAASYMP